MQQFAGAHTFLMLSVSQNFPNNHVRLIRFLLNELNALIVALPTITKQQTKVVYTTRLPLFNCLYRLVPDFFLMSIFS